MKKPSTRSARPSVSNRWWWLLPVGLLIWVSIDLSGTRRNSLRAFDPKRLASTETAMWRSYYEKKPLRLFWQLTTGLREQFHAPFWRSFRLGFQATKAAFDFKKGKTDADYRRVLPDLTTYYQAIQQLCDEPFNVPLMAERELDWWVVHRQRERYSYDDLARALAETAATQYSQPVTPFLPYGKLRAEAMRLRDESSRRAGGTTEAEWKAIETVLDGAWSALHGVVQRP